MTHNNHSLFTLKTELSKGRTEKFTGRRYKSLWDTPYSCLGLCSGLSVELANVKLECQTKELATKGILHHTMANLVQKKSLLNVFSMHTHTQRCNIYTIIIVYMLCYEFYIEVYTIFIVCEYPW